jgi:hypothetical protein
MSKHDDVPRDAAGEIDPTGERSPEERRVRFYRALRDAGYSDLTIVRREDVANEFKRKLRRIPRPIVGGEEADTRCTTPAFLWIAFH